MYFRYSRYSKPKPSETDVQTSLYPYKNMLEENISQVYLNESLDFDIIHVVFSIFTGQRQQNIHKVFFFYLLIAIFRLAFPLPVLLQDAGMEVIDSLLDLPHLLLTSLGIDPPPYRQVVLP